MREGEVAGGERQRGLEERGEVATRYTKKEHSGPQMEEFAEIEFNYGGKMVEGGEHVEYKGGLQKVMTVGLASVTHFELSCTAAVDLQYERIEKMWYLDNGLHRVSSDSNLKNCLDTAPGCPKKIFIYLEGVSRPGSIHHEGVVGENNDSRLSGSGSDSDSVSVEHSAVRGVSHLVDNDDRTSDEEFNAAMGFLGVRRRRIRVGMRDDMSGEEVEQLSVFESDVIISSSSNEGDQPNDETRTNTREGPRSPPPGEYESNHSSYRGSEDSDHVRGNLSDEDGEGNYSRGPLYDPGCDHGALQFELGLRFRDPTQFKEAVIRNSIIIGANVRWMRSSKTWREVVYKHPSCKWRLYAAWYRGRELFVVKQIGAAHSCPRKSRNTQATAKWIANDLLERFRISPNIEIEHILAEMKLKYGLELEPRQCYREKVEARKLLTGTLEAEYMKIRSYIAELRRADPRGRFIVEVDTADSLDFVYFKRIFVCFSSLNEGFLRGCRPMFGLDGCFLKGEVSGMILSAVGKDGNDQMYRRSCARTCTRYLCYTIDDLFFVSKVGTGRGGPRKCGTCKQPGHNSRSCPTKRGIQVVEINDSRRSVVQRELNTIVGVGVYTNPTTGNTYYRVRTGVH
ncbi:hypothetical protein LINPERHAP2_LOCUS531 [Linum perenne]